MAVDSSNYGSPFARRFRELLENRNGISPLDRPVKLAELERATGIARQSLAFYRSGRVSPDVIRARVIADFFQTSLSFMCGQTDTPGLP